MKKSLLLYLFVIAFVHSNSQVTTFTYTGISNFSESNCNVLSSATNINSTPHKTYAGAIGYSSSNGLWIKVRPTAGGTAAGTALVIAYSFTADSKYTIKINARGNQNLRLKACATASLSGYPTNGGNNCELSEDVNNWNVNGIGPINVTTTTSFADYDIAEFQPSSSTGNLLIWATGGTPSLSIDGIDIKSVTITRTPIASFTLSSSSGNITCGSTAPITFTVTNGANTPNVTNHTWNLGNNNGWLFNGNPAPATISTGTTDTITLTPDCGKALSNVSATVTAGSNNFNTNTATISVSQPTYSISGSSNICSGSTNYSINGLVCNSSVAWTAPPSNLATLSSLTTSTTTLTATGASGDFTLTANVTSCGVTSPPVTLAVKTGALTASDYTMFSGSSSTQPLLWCSGRTYSFSISGPNPSNIVWTPPQGWTITVNGGSYCVMRAPGGSTPPSDAVSVSFTEPCGTTITKTFQTGFSTSACTGTDPRFTFSPNPAPTTLNVAVASLFRPPFGSGVFIQRIQIIRIQTGMTVFDSNYGSGVLNATISTSTYATGNYTLRIFDGTIWAVYQFVK